MTVEEHYGKLMMLPLPAGVEVRGAPVPMRGAWGQKRGGAVGVTRLAIHVAL